MSSLAELSKLVGFFSYSREDDEDFKGTLSALRDGIHRELRAQLGRTKADFDLWQDQKSIKLGKNWKTEIKSAINGSAFMIPIITPRAVNSEHCKFELEAFLGREQALGRSDLMFPILYIPVPKLEIEDKWRADPVLSIIGLRQFVNWNPLRHLDATSASVREEISRFCRNIVDALNEPWMSLEERDPEVLSIFAEQYPQSPHAKIAIERLNEIKTKVPKSNGNIGGVEIKPASPPDRDVSTPPSSLLTQQDQEVSTPPLSPTAPKDQDVSTPPLSPTAPKDQDVSTPPVSPPRSEPRPSPELRSKANPAWIAVIITVVMFGLFLLTANSDSGASGFWLLLCLAGIGVSTWYFLRSAPPARVYRVFVLGAPGSGKTVFLASLYAHLVVQNQQNKFALETVSNKQKQFLLQTFEQIKNPAKSWPQGTRTDQEFKFNCVHHSKNGIFSLFQIIYLDYPGGFVYGNVDAGFDIERETQKADSILVLIDGRKVFEKLEGYEQDEKTLDYDLHWIVPRLQNSSDKPIHFLVTKWDIIGALHSLDDVKKALLDNEAFFNFVASRKDGCLRLIPVSAVGNKFAKYNAVARQMEKVKGGEVRPYNVDLSIVLTIIDQLVAFGRKAIELNEIPLWIVKALRTGSVVVRKAAEQGELLGVPATLNMKILLVLTTAERHLDATEREIERSISQVDRKSAFQAIVEMQAYRMKKFIREYPQSSLTGVAETWLSPTGHS